jgi:hypothetical protein
MPYDFITPTRNGLQDWLAESTAYPTPFSLSIESQTIICMEPKEDCWWVVVNNALMRKDYSVRTPHPWVLNWAGRIFPASYDDDEKEEVQCERG